MDVVQQGRWTAATVPRSSGSLMCSLVGLSLFLFALAAAGCNLLNPEAGLPSPKDPGSIIVLVRDQAAAGVSGVRVSVEMPNAGGGVFRVARPTDSDGKAEFRGVPAGRRRVEVVPPAGFGGNELIRDVDVTKDRTTQVEFVLIRN